MVCYEHLPVCIGIDIFGILDCGYDRWLHDNQQRPQVLAHRSHLQCDSWLLLCGSIFRHVCLLVPICVANDSPSQSWPLHGLLGLYGHHCDRGRLLVLLAAHLQCVHFQHRRCH